ncbi:MAG TPA: maleylpyruvate isomerase family mycothiol-dependent enzyme [Acidimicrobiia bacterium]|nr:maleylpyruvate isomerase family mycothiol-dependent enzyme [Acidimicrobiia bacterium]
MSELDTAAVEELLGAYALDACDTDETEAIEAVLARDPALAREAERLRHAAAWIGATEALEPPTGLRASLLESVRSRTRAASGLDPSVDLYAGETDALADVVAVVDDAQLELGTANGLSVRDLIIHCAAQESLAAQLVGRPTVPELTDTDIDARTAALRDRLAGRPVADAVDVWRASVDALRDWATDPANRDATVRWLGAEVARPDVLTIRAFESWIHADDIRRALGQPLATPPARHLSLMSDFSGRTTGFGLLMANRSRPGRTARLVLTGHGGGEWLIAMGGGEPGTSPDVTLTTDVVDWCRLVGERIAPDELECTVEGDPALAEDLLVAASAFATL